jgi:hypothetical protein
MKTRWTILLVACAINLVSCGKSPRVDATHGGSEHRDWLLANSAADYIRIGKKNAKWDRSVLQAFTNYAEVRSAVTTNTSTFWRGEFRRAVESGCDDPLVRSFALRVEDRLAQSTDTIEAMDRWTNSAATLEKSDYSHFQKFFMDVCAVNALHVVTGTNSYGQVAYFYNLALDHMDAILGDKSTPAEETLLIVTDFINSMKWSSNGRQQILDRAEPALKQAHSGSWQTLHLTGAIELERAWLARGGKPARKVSQEQWDGYYKHAEKAEQILREAWQREPHVETAIKMMEIQLCYQNTRDRMEEWFNRAMNLKTNSYDAASQKYHYLKPIWHGSRADQHEFALQCVNSTNWGGNVPLIMIDFHRDTAASYPEGRQAYFGRQDVWQEIRAAFDKFFQINPEATGWHHDYFWYAYCAKDWKVAERELDLLGDDISYHFFGGEDRFREIAREVRRQAKATQ